MAFNKNTYARVSASYSKNAPMVFTYSAEGDTKADIQVPDYFVDLLYELRVGDFIFIEAFDGPIAVAVNSLDKITRSLTVIVFIP